MNIKKELEYIELSNTQIHEVLQFPSSNFHILKSFHDSLLLVVIIYCQCKYDYFILLILYNIFVLCNCGYIFVIVFDDAKKISRPNALCFNELVIVWEA